MKARAEFDQSLLKMKNNLKSISDLLVRGSLALHGEEHPADPWVLRPLFESDDVSVGLVNIRTEKSIPCEPHVHANSNEYLVVTKGKLLLTINDRAVRVVNAGECASIPMGALHFSQPLTEDTELVYICVPKDHEIPTTVRD